MTVLKYKKIMRHLFSIAFVIVIASLNIENIYAQEEAVQETVVTSVVEETSFENLNLELTNKLNDLESTIRQKDKSLNECVTNVDSFEAKNAQLESSLSTLNTEKTALETKLKTNVKTLETKNAELEASLLALNTEKTTLEEKLAAVEESQTCPEPEIVDTSKYEIEINELTTSIEKLKDDKSNLEKEMLLLKEISEQDKNDKSSLEKEMVQLKESYEQSQIEARSILEKEIASLKGTIEIQKDELQSEKETIKKQFDLQIKEKDTIITGKDNQISTINSELNKFKTKISTLEAELSETSNVTLFDVLKRDALLLKHFCITKANEGKVYIVEVFYPSAKAKITDFSVYIEKQFVPQMIDTVDNHYQKAIPIAIDIHDNKIKPFLASVKEKTQPLVEQAAPHYEAVVQKVKPYYDQMMSNITPEHEAMIKDYQNRVQIGIGKIKKAAGKLHKEFVTVINEKFQDETLSIKIVNGFFYVLAILTAFIFRGTIFMILCLPFHIVFAPITIPYSIIFKTPASSKSTDKGVAKKGKLKPKTA